MNFIKFRDAVTKQLDAMYKHDELFNVNVSKDKMWEVYLGSFPADTNPIYVERTQHDCNCCKGFIRQVGNIIAIKGGKVITPWDVKVDDEYQAVADAMAELIRKAPISNVFRADMSKIGAKENYQQLTNGDIKTWNHFHTVIPTNFVMRDAGTFLSAMQADCSVLRRSIEEISMDSINIVLDLIAEDGIYRGQEHKSIVTKLKQLKTAYDKLKNARAREVFLWSTAVDLKAAGRIRNTVIGTLLVALSEGTEIDAAVASFEQKVAPQNYKRTSAVVTKGMIQQAEKTVKELGLETALKRRFANETDLTINNVLFADHSVKTGMAGSSVFDDLMTAQVPDKVPSKEKVEKVSIDQFLTDILPKVNSIELMLENRMQPNLMSVIAPADADAPNILKWGNNFSWTYSGDVTDSIKERVKSAGGNVFGEVRISLAWQNGDDLDLHCETPSGTIFFRNTRAPNNNGGLDVDMNAGCIRNAVDPVENITFNKISNMDAGSYRVRVNNYNQRQASNGFSVEVEFNGQVYTFSTNTSPRSGATVDVCSFTKDKAGNIKLTPIMESTTTSKEVWGINTQKFTKVNMVMNSPNHWDGEETGNKHVFFILEGCQNPEAARGLYNEFLKNELNPHRKVFEVLGSKLRAEHTNKQLSGVGFSTTKRDSVTLRVKGSYNRVIEVAF